MQTVMPHRTATAHSGVGAGFVPLACPREPRLALKFTPQSVLGKLPHRLARGGRRHHRGDPAVPHPDIELERSSTGGKGTQLEGVKDLAGGTWARFSRAAARGHAGAYTRRRGPVCKLKTQPSQKHAHPANTAQERSSAHGDSSADGRQPDPCRSVPSRSPACVLVRVLTGREHTVRPATDHPSPGPGRGSPLASQNPVSLPPAAPPRKRRKTRKAGTQPAQRNRSAGAHSSVELTPGSVAGKPRARLS